MIRLKKKFATMSAAELAAESKRLKGQIFKAQAEMAVGKLTNTRTVFNLRKQLATCLTYASTHR